MVGGSSYGANINFGKYMDKKPKYEKEFGKSKESTMQEMGTVLYKPPEIGTQYKNDNNA